MTENAPENPDEPSEVEVTQPNPYTGSRTDEQNPGAPK